jgi:hypothetical protein
MRFTIPTISDIALTKYVKIKGFYKSRQRFRQRGIFSPSTGDFQSVDGD